MPDKHPILLIAFKFPPYSQVGAFRWTRLSRHLAELGHRVDVVTVEWRTKEPGGLLKDVDHPGIRIHRIPSGYLHNLKYWKGKHHWINALKGRLFSRFIDKIFFWDDEAQRWGAHLLPKCEELIRSEGIRTVIATGSPFQSNRWAAVLKTRNPSIRLIQDLRDPWVRNPFKTYRDPAAAMSMERESLSVADDLVVVSRGMAEHFRENLSRDVPVTVINNGFDPGVVRPRQSQPARPGPKTIVYAGSLANGREQLLRELLDALQRRNIDALRVVVIGYYTTSLAERYRTMIEDGRLELRGWVAPEVAIAAISAADYALQLNSRMFPYALSTKIYEYAAMGVPTLSLNYGGDIDELIRAHSLGYSINLDDVDLDDWLMRLLADELEKDFAFSVEGFSYRNLAVTYSDLIQRQESATHECTN